MTIYKPLKGLLVFTILLIFSLLLFFWSNLRFFSFDYIPFINYIFIFVGIFLVWLPLWGYEKNIDRVRKKWAVAEFFTGLIFLLVFSSDSSVFQNPTSLKYYFVGAIFIPFIVLFMWGWRALRNINDTLIKNH